jgi:hypothetical protein
LGRIREDKPKKVVPADTGAKSSSSIFFYPWLSLFLNRSSGKRSEAMDQEINLRLAAA